MLALALVLILRAAVVPSTGRRTLAVGFRASSVLVAGYYARDANAPFSDFTLPWMLAFTLASGFVRASSTACRNRSARPGSSASTC